MRPCIVSRLPHDHARFEFALAAYPRTVDPEEFYDVYDAFDTFSMVFRLHDEIGPLRKRGRPHAHVTTHRITNEQMKEILKAVKAETFDKDKLRLSRQILTDSIGRVSSAQVKEMLGLLQFDTARLELAKVGYDHVCDPEQYFVVNDAFTFSSHRRELSKYIEGRRESRGR